MPFNTETPLRYAMGCVLVDQSVWALFITSYYLMVINYLENGTLKSGIDSIKDKYFDIILANYKIWPAT